MDKAYNPKQYENKIYEKWEKSGFFNPDNLPGDRPQKFSIAMPPPNATGILHLGHATMLAISDTILRYKRMRGFNALWISGTDHASIATQAKVEKIISGEGLNRHGLGREKFLERVAEFVEESRNTIRSQIKQMGSSCDWSRERYTLDDGLSKAVQEIFVRMYNDGLIYRGSRIVNWCPRCESTLADDEVEHKEEQGKLYYIKYPLEDGENFITIATTRPETMLGDTAIAVNPKDERYSRLIGKMAKLPLSERLIPVIADEHVDIKFGTGALKITPAHDKDDFEIGKRHGLDVINIFNNNGTLNENAGKFSRMPLNEAREKVIKELQNLDLVEKIEAYAHSVGKCYRCDTVIEPLISLQWFIDVDKKIPERDKSLKELSIEAVKSGKIKIIPERFDKIYFHWMENLHNWCISRQIWWGHRIPAYYCECGQTVVSLTKPTHCWKCNSDKFTQDPDTLDTWFSSGLWTFSTLGWPEKTSDLQKFHPTSLMETGYDILFFWVARMIIMSEYALGDIPFETVYLHGMVLDKFGKKMSKSKNTGIDPVDMINKFGADALRMSMLVGVSAGNDFRLYEEKIGGYKNFVNKLWNIARYINQTTVETQNFASSTPPLNPPARNATLRLHPPASLCARLQRCSNCGQEAFRAGSVARPHRYAKRFGQAGGPLREGGRLSDQWILSELNSTIDSVTENLEKYQLSQAAETLYDFTWNKLADWYLEISKVEKNKEAILKFILETILKLWHPFMPFVTEAIWQEIGEKNLLMIEKWPEKIEISEKENSKKFIAIKNIVTKIRNARTQYKVEPGKIIDIFFAVSDISNTKFIESQKEIIEKLAKVKILDNEIGIKSENSAQIILDENTAAYLTLGHGIIDEEKEKLRNIKELESLKSFSEKLEKELSNENFIKNAPEKIVALKKEQLEKTKEKIKQISHNT